MKFSEFFDLRVLLVLVTASLWMPFAKLVWRAVNPYPHLFSDKRMRREGPKLDMPLVSEEWADLRRLRSTQAAADTAKPVQRGFGPAPRSLASVRTGQSLVLKRGA